MDQGGSGAWMYRNICMCSCGYVHVCVSVCRSKRLMSAVFLSCSLHVLRLGLSLNLEFTGSVRLTGQRALGVHQLLPLGLSCPPSVHKHGVYLITITGEQFCTAPITLSKRDAKTWSQGAGGHTPQKTGPAAGRGPHLFHQSGLALQQHRHEGLLEQVHGAWVQHPAPQGVCHQIAVGNMGW